MYLHNDIFKTYFYCSALTDCILNELNFIKRKQTYSFALIGNDNFKSNN